MPAQTIEAGRHRLTLAARETVGPPTPYTMLFLEAMPDLAGAVAVDVGTGSGALAIAACLQGAIRVYILDTNLAAIEAALENARLNGVEDKLVPLATGSSMIPLPEGERVDVIISNPAQLPLPQSAEALSPYYAGPDGREMIDAVISAAPAALNPGGRLLMVQNSVTHLPTTLALMRTVGLEPQVLAERSLELRPLFDRAWIDELGGVARGLYSLRDGRAYETIYALEARARG
jgi:release factor glutamine methyltransferase